MSELGLNTYLYGPKDDLKHRTHWRELYSKEEIGFLEKSILQCQQANIDFGFALGPGLDIEYGSEEDLEAIKQRFKQFLERGVTLFALLLDDIPDAMTPRDQGRFRNFAEGHCHLANALQQWITRDHPNGRLLFCPTPYCSRMAESGLGGDDYLETIGEQLAPAIDVFWTGPEIISETISDAHLKSLSERIGRKPLLWDNLYANDYDLRRLFLGPYLKRPLEPANVLSGIILNPNCEFEANWLPVTSLANYLKEPTQRVLLEAHEKAIINWLPSFESVGVPWSSQDVTTLVDVFYLPHLNGPWANQLHTLCQQAINAPLEQREALQRQVQERLSEIVGLFDKLTELKNRDLLHTFYRQWWDLREEVQLIAHYLQWRNHAASSGKTSFKSPEHHRGTFRGGTVASIQSLLTMNHQGEVSPANHD